MPFMGNYEFRTVCESLVTNSGAIPVPFLRNPVIPEDSGGIPVIPADSGGIPVDSCGISGFRTESVGHCKVLTSTYHLLS
jgi:hypothetical protein